MRHGTLRRLGLGLAATLALALPQPAWAACSVTTYTDTNGNQGVLVKGDANIQNIVVQDDNGGSKVQVDCDNDTLYTGPTDFDLTIATPTEIFDIQGGGKDTVQIIPAATGAYTSVSRNFKVTLGPTPATVGNVLVIQNGNGMTNSNVVVDILGSTGPDFVVNFMPVGSVTLLDSTVIVRGDLGAGNDEVLNFAASSTLNNTAVTEDLALGSGVNSLVHEAISMPMGNLAAATFAYDGSDLGSNKEEFQLIDYLGLFTTGTASWTSLNAMAGNDTVLDLALSGQFAAGTYQRSRVKLGAGNDILNAISGNGNFESLVGEHQMNFSGGLGNDVMTFDVDSWEGNGRMHVNMAGGDGNDTLISAIETDSSASTPDLELAMSGNRGVDTLFSAVIDRTGAGTYDYGQMLMNCGDYESYATGVGPDTAVVFGDGESVTDVLNCELGS